jgi:Na+-driven multidrug efflux pump
MSRAATMHKDDLLLIAQNENDASVVQFRNDTAEKILDEIKAVDAPYFQIPLFTKIKLFCNLIFPSILMAITHSGNTFVNTMGFYIAGKQNNTTISTAFGLTIFFNMISIYSLTQPIIEKVGISCAKSFGSKDYDAVKEHFLRGMIMFLIYTALIHAPIIIFAENLMLAIGIIPDVAEVSADYQALLFPIDITRLLGEIVVTYMVSQGIESSFGVFTMTNSLIGMGVAYYFGLQKNMGVQGWMIGRATFDLLNVLSIFGVYAFRMKGNRIRRANLSKAYTGLGQYFCDVVKYTIVLYSEVIGWEISTLLCAMTNDANQIGAFSSIVNMAYIVWNIGNGFSNTARTRINYLLGQKKGKAAKNFFTIVLFGMITFALTIGVILYFGSGTIGDLYASTTPEIRAYVVQLAELYAFLTTADFLFAYMFTITRSTNLVIYNMFLDYVFLIGFHAVVSYTLIKLKYGSCKTVLLCLDGSIYVIYVFLFAKLFSMDWDKIEFKDEDESEDNNKRSLAQDTSFSQEGNEPLKGKK